MDWIVEGQKVGLKGTNITGNILLIDNTSSGSHYSVTISWDQEVAQAKVDPYFCEDEIEAYLEPIKEETFLETVERLSYEYNRASPREKKDILKNKMGLRELGDD